MARIIKIIFIITGSYSNPTSTFNKFCVPMPENQFKKRILYANVKNAVINIPTYSFTNIRNLLTKNFNITGVSKAVIKLKFTLTVKNR